MLMGLSGRAILAGSMAFKALLSDLRPRLMTPSTVCLASDVGVSESS